MECECREQTPGELTSDTEMDSRGHQTEMDRAGDDPYAASSDDEGEGGSGNYEIQVGNIGAHMAMERPHAIILYTSAR